MASRHLVSEGSSNAGGRSGATSGLTAYDGELAGNILLEDDAPPAAAVSVGRPARSNASGGTRPSDGGGTTSNSPSSATPAARRRSELLNVPQRTPTRTPSPVYQWNNPKKVSIHEEHESASAFRDYMGSDSKASLKGGGASKGGNSVDAPAPASPTAPLATSESNQASPVSVFQPVPFPVFNPFWSLQAGALNPQAYYAGVLMGNPLLGQAAVARAAAQSGTAAAPLPGSVGSLPGVSDGGVCTSTNNLDPRVLQMLMAIQPMVVASAAVPGNAPNSPNNNPSSPPLSPSTPLLSGPVDDVPDTVSVPQASAAAPAAVSSTRSANAASNAKPAPSPSAVAETKRTKSRGKETAAGPRHLPSGSEWLDSGAAPPRERVGKNERRRRGGGGGGRNEKGGGGGVSAAPGEPGAAKGSNGGGACNGERLFAPATTASGCGGSQDDVHEDDRQCVGPGSNRPKAHPGSPLIEQLKLRDRSVELSELCWHIGEIAQDQYGSRLIQQKLEVATEEEKQMAFKAILQRMPQLTTDVFGNYVIQKFFEHGSSEQRRVLAEQLVGQVLNLSLQMYGCRVVQKALDSVPIEQQVLLVGELRGHVLKCIEDQHGNHVIQKCIERLPTEKINFIVEAFNGEVSRMAKHCYGCRVIQRLIEYCSSMQISALLDEVLRGCMELASDQYGNYVVQHALEHSTRGCDRQFVLHLVCKNVLSLSCHKYASNVVEKALSCGTLEERALVIGAIVGDPNDAHPPLLTMMRDRFGNYIVQKTINMSQGPQRGMIIWRLEAQMPVLKKSNTYGKHIIAALQQAQTEP